MKRTCWNPQFDGTLMELFDPGFLEESFLIGFYGGKKVCKIWQSIWERSQMWTLKKISYSCRDFL